MARNEKLEAEVRTALAKEPDVAEKQMFRGAAFMVNGKLCISAGDQELMFRFDPALHNELLQQPGCREMLRNGKPIKGYLYVHTSALTTSEDLRRWVALALAYNKKAKAAGKKKARA